MYFLINWFTSTASFRWSITSRRVSGGASQWLRLVRNAVHVRVAPTLRCRCWGSGSGGRDVTKSWLAVCGLGGRWVVSQGAGSALPLDTAKHPFPDKTQQTTMRAGAKHSIKVILTGKTYLLEPGELSLMVRKSLEELTFLNWACSQG